MPYVVFARKYRPQLFDEVVGQEHITTTLKNAIKFGRVAHAYLFAGSRGIGKTTTARILAKALNCEKGQTPEPCNICSACVEITQGSNLDILEIDGATNRGIDEVRNLRDNVKFAPSKARFKIYIIDEVHMLTTEAFNALLKTLEEPPAHVKFIFATTQPQKVPATILSRCQRFDFRKIPKTRIIEHLMTIAKKESMDISADALDLIVKYSEGSMRDAEVMLDQIASFTRGSVGADDVAGMLGVVEEDALFALSDAVASRDAACALKAVDSLVNGGKDPGQLVTAFIEHLRNMLVAKIAPEPTGLIDSSPERIERLVRSSKAFTVEEMLYSLYALSNAVELARRTSLTRIPLEITLVKLCERSRITSLDEILRRIEDVEARMGGTPVVGCKETERKREIPERAAPVPLKEPVSAPRSETDRPDRGGPSRQSPQDRGADSVQAIADSWQGILNYLHEKKISVGAYLLEGRPQAIEGEFLVIAFSRDFRFHKESLEESPDHRALIEEAIRVTCGKDYRVKLVVTEEEVPAQGDRQASSSGASGSGRDPGTKGASGRLDPVVDYAVNIFNGEVVAKDRVPPKGRSK